MDPMTPQPKRSHLQLPENYYELTEQEQKAVCLELAKKMQHQLGISPTNPRRSPSPGPTTEP